MSLPNLGEASWPRVLASSGSRVGSDKVPSPNLGREEETMLRTFVIALLATAMSVSLADAKGHKPKAPPKALPYCQNAQQTKDTCACGPAKVVCPKGMWCHSFISTC